MSKHTDGLWEYARYCGDVFDIGAVGYRESGQSYADKYICETVGEANARLIAAAPEMLAMLKRLEWGGCQAYTDERCCPVCDELEYSWGKLGVHAPDCELAALIAKAGGEG